MAMSGFGGLLGAAPAIGQGMSQFASGLGNLFGDLFGHPDRPYQKASDVLSQYMPQAQSYLNPFLQAGQGAIPGYQAWLQGMQNPSGFINNLMGKYQESPYAKYQQEQGLRAAQNMGSASGLTGSTPLIQFAQQNAQNISSQDMNQWLQNVLGINQQYGAGQFGLMGQGQQAGNALTNMMQQYMANQADLAAAQEQAKQGRTGGIIKDIFNLF